MNDPPRKRRSLTNVGGPIDVAGDEADAALLASALDVPASRDDQDGSAPADDDPARAHVHGFHTYPARMHPVTASRLVHAFAPARGVVLDPFCGSGTVLVESMVAGRRAVGTDLNPLAVRLARCKTRPRSPKELTVLVDHARELAAFADERRKTRAGATRKFPPEDVDIFEPHVLLELDSLRAGLEKLGEPAARADLALVLSALLVKLSKKRGDTSDVVDKRRTAAGYTAKLFVKKTEDLTRRLAAFASLLPSPAPPAARVELDDATALRTIARDETIDAVVTSPPYAATYDYAAHHALRLRWLGLDPRPLDAGEIGARRNYAAISPAEAHEVWSNELARFLDAIARVLPSGAPVVLMMADSASKGVALRADDIVAALARPHGFVPAARASQERTHFHGPTRHAFRDRPRAEHALLLRRA
ncbi:MAG: DNA methyltransferase [Polyangiaceae bacterium]